MTSLKRTVCDEISQESITKVVRHEAVRDNAAWFDTGMAGTLNGSNMFRVSRSVVVSLEYPQPM